MSIYDNIPIEHHGMSEWTFLVFVFIAVAVSILIKLLIMWKEAHDSHMSEQVKRIDAHEVQLNSVGTDLVVIKTDIGHVKESVTRMEEPLKDMSELNRMVIKKVLEEKDE
jgi:5-bromo-4-chloroindolyl phosphate hydrolysis protein